MAWRFIDSERGGLQRHDKHRTTLPGANDHHHNHDHRSEKETSDAPKARGVTLVLSFFYRNASSTAAAWRSRGFDSCYRSDLPFLWAGEPFVFYYYYFFFFVCKERIFRTCTSFFFTSSPFGLLQSSMEEPSVPFSIFALSIVFVFLWTLIFVHEGDLWGVLLLLLLLLLERLIRYRDAE